MRSLTLSPLSGPPPPPPLYTHTLRHQCGTWVTGRDVVVGNEAVIDETRRLSFTVSLQQLQPRPEKFTDESSLFFSFSLSLSESHGFKVSTSRKLGLTPRGRAEVKGQHVRKKQK